MTNLLKLLYMMLPAAFANSMGTLSRGINFLNVPVDFGRSLFGKRILGKNKTWRGVFFGTLMGIIVTLIQTYLYRFPTFRSISIIDYSSVNPIIFGFLLGFGDILGDLIESFVKRRLDIKPGEPFIPFDQIDGPIVALILTYGYHHLPILDIFELLTAWFILHIVIRHIAFYLGINKKKW